MRRAPALLAAFLFVLAAFLPAPALAAPCSETAPVVRFDANPKTDVAPNSETRFTFKFRFSAPCEGGTTLRSETHDVSGGIDRTVRSRDWNLAAHPELRDADEDNWDFNATWITTPGTHLFNGRVLLDGRQITASSPVTVTAAGTPTGGPASSGGEGGPPQAGPVPLEVTIGSYASAVDIPSYVTALYRYGLGVGVTLAMVMVVVGGFQYMTARGNPSAVGAARGRITNAILGLLLLLGSFTLLQTINPDLVTLRNIIVPEIQRVETISNKCEDFDRATFTVTPATGRCGEAGTVARRDSTQLATNTCTWGVCGADGDVCVIRGADGPGCVQCGDVIDDDLQRWGLGENNAACDRFSPPNVSSTVRKCIYIEDPTFDFADDACAIVTVNCSSVSRCGDYDAALRVGHRGEFKPLEQLKGGDGHADERVFGEWCARNPCTEQVSGPCHGRRNIGTFASSFAGDFWDCMEGPG